MTTTETENKIEVIMELIRELTFEERIKLYGAFVEEYCGNCWGNCSGRCVDIDSIPDWD